MLVFAKVNGTSVPGPPNKHDPSLGHQLTPVYTTLLQTANVQKPLQGALAMV